jgi:hypothetical protein
VMSPIAWVKDITRHRRSPNRRVHSAPT